MSRLLPLIVLLISILNLIGFGVTWYRAVIVLLAYVLVVATSVEKAALDSQTTDLLAALAEHNIHSRGDLALAATAEEGE